MTGREVHEPCDDRIVEMEALLAGELTGAGQAALEAHLAECEGCRAALGEAREGAVALRSLDRGPAPWLVPDGAGETADARWRAFLDRRVLSTPGWFTFRPLAAAAMLVFGVALGRWVVPARAGSGPRPVASGPAWIGADQVGALTRAEVLVDLGMPYLDGLREVVDGVLEGRTGGVNQVALLNLRDRARRLIDDGQSLEAVLDETRDAEFLSTIRRAEVFLEEIGALGAGEGGPDLGLVRREIENTDLSARLASLDLPGSAQAARVDAGWIGNEGDTPTGGRP